MANYGYGGFLYSRGVYGSNRTQGGAVVSSWNESSSATASRRPTVGMPKSAWVWSSTAASQGITSARLHSNWMWTNTQRKGRLSARAAALHPATWKSTITGIGAHSGNVASNAIWADHISGNTKVTSPRTSSWISASMRQGAILTIGTAHSNWTWNSIRHGQIHYNGARFSFWFCYSNSRPTIRANSKIHTNWNEWSKITAMKRVVDNVTSNWNSYDGIISGRLLWITQDNPPDPNWIPQAIGPDIWTPIHK